LDIGTTEAISFLVEGKNSVHLSGYVYWFSGEDESEDEYDSEDIYGSSDLSDEERAGMYFEFT